MAATIDELRKQLREKFPAAHASLRAPAAEAPVDLNPFQEATYPVGALSEVVPAGAFSPLGLLIAGLLGESDEVADFPDFVLVDGGDALDPDSLGEAACSRLLWVRCSSPMDWLKAGELLIRDGNLPTILLDVSRVHAKHLRQIPSSSWWRLKQAAEETGSRVLVLAPFPLVPCARLRLSLTGTLSLTDLACSRSELLARVGVSAAKLHRYAN